MNRRQLLFRRALRNNQGVVNMPKAIVLTERPVSTMDTVAKIEAIGLISSEIEAAAKGMRYGMTYEDQNADFFYHISAASFSTDSDWSITFEHTRWEDNSGTPADGEGGDGTPDAPGEGGDDNPEPVEGGEGGDGNPDAPGEGGDGNPEPVEGAQSVYITVSRADASVSVYSYEIPT